MSSEIQNILENIVGDGARSTKFDCMINFNSTDLFPAEKDIYALVKTSQFPGKTHDVIDMKYKGRTIPIKGQVKYDNTWSCTFYLTEDHALKIAFENWIESLDQQHNIKSVGGGIKRAQAQNYSSYAGTLHIAQMNFQGNEQCVLYTLHHCFPKSVSAVDVDYSEVGQIGEFTVEFSYAYFDASTQKSESGNFIDELVDRAKGGANYVKSSIKDAMNGLINNAKNSIKGAITSQINSAVGSVASSASQMIGQLSGSVNKISKGISSSFMGSGFF